MDLLDDRIEANRAYFAAKLAAEKGKYDVEQRLTEKPATGHFILLDVRSRKSYILGHIRGAFSLPLSELKMLIPLLPKGKELVTYCSHHF